MQLAASLPRGLENLISATSTLTRLCLPGIISSCGSRLKSVPVISLNIVSNQYPDSDFPPRGSLSMVSSIICQILGSTVL